MFASNDQIISSKTVFEIEIVTQEKIIFIHSRVSPVERGKTYNYFRR